MLWRRFLFNAVFFTGLLAWTFFFVLVSPLLWLKAMCFSKGLRKEAIRGYVHFYGRGCCWLLTRFIAVHVDLAAGGIPEPCIFAANHQSFFDPYCMGFVARTNLVFVVRSWPFRIPVYGRVMRYAGYLNIDELDAEEFLCKAKALLRAGATLVVFPEGTRSGNGELGRFRSGAFKLALATRAPIVPMCIDGSGNIFPRGSRFGRIADLRVSFLDAVDPAPFLAFGEMSHSRLQRHVKAAIQKHLRRAVST